jgi:hypothetical protein
MIKKEGTKTCLFCSKKISLKKDNFVLVATCNRVSKPDDEAYFHFVCWVDYFNQCVLNKARNNIRMIQSKAMELFNNPVMKGLLSQIQGSGQIMSMLQMPLQERADPVLVSKISQKIQNDRKKRSAKKRKPQKMQKM